MVHESKRHLSKQPLDFTLQLLFITGVCDPVVLVDSCGRTERTRSGSLVIHSLQLDEQKLR